MPTYSDKKKNNNNNINYLNKDFDSIKDDLINYSKTYFPDTYNDFNETSHGMMMMEMTAYVGDVLSFYVDQNFKEIMLPTATERRNVINIANTLGYKVRAAYPSIAKVKLTQTVGFTGTDLERTADFGDAMVINEGMQIRSTQNPNIFFETLDVIDFNLTGSFEPEIETTNSTTGFAETFTLTKEAFVMSSTTKEIDVTIDSSEQFLEIELPDTNVISIESVFDSNNNRWYEVEYLVQDKVLNDKHYYNDSGRTNNAFLDYDGNVLNIPVPYTIDEPIETNKRFVKNVDENNITKLIFGNGLVRQNSDISILRQIYDDNQQLNNLIDSTLPTSDVVGDSSNFSSLGEAPANTTLNIRYKVGGGLDSNVPSGDLTNVVSKTLSNSVSSVHENSLTITNEQPARGATDNESIEEIKERAKFNFISQKRAVTKQDYEALTMSMPPKYGNISNVFVNRRSAPIISAGTYGTAVTGLTSLVLDHYHTYEVNTGGDGVTNTVNGHYHGIEGNTIMEEDYNGVPHSHSLQLDTSGASYLPGISIYVLSHDDDKNLVKTPDIIKSNLANYLNFYKLISDDIIIEDGVVINFGVYFHIIAEDGYNKNEVKFNCINEIIEYFKPDNMKFNQIIYTNALENLLYSIDGVKYVKDAFLTQSGNSLNLSNDLHASGGVPSNGVAGENINDYGFGYRFNQFYDETSNGVANKGVGVILPPHIQSTPGIFELKNPKDNVKGIVE